MVRRTEDDFLASVYTVSSRTVIDEAALSSAMSDLNSCLEALGRTRVSCEQAQEAIYSAGDLQWCDYRSLEAICALGDYAAVQERELEVLRENIGMTLLIFYAAEQKSESFFALRTRLFPSVRSALEYEAEKPRYLTEHILLLYPVFNVKLFSWKINDFSSVVTDQALLTAAPFTTGVASDKADLLAATFHLNRFANSQLEIPFMPRWKKMPQNRASIRYFRSNGRGSWWSGRPTKMPVGSALSAIVMNRLNERFVGHHTKTGFVAQVENSKGERLWISRDIPNSAMCDLGACVAPLSVAARRHDLGEDKKQGYGSAVPVQQTATPYKPSDLVGRIEKLAESQDYGQFEILRHDTPDVDGREHRSWSVIIRGTQKWSLGETNPQDLLTNFKVNGGLGNVQLRVREAIQMKGSRQKICFITGYTRGKRSSSK